jgi:hypothetical protein
LGEPEDMFGNAGISEDAGVEAPESSPPSAPSALGAGVLKPRMADVQTPVSYPMPEMQPNTLNTSQPTRPSSFQNGNPGAGSLGEMPSKIVVPPPGMGADGDISTIREPIGSKKTITIIIVVVLIIILGLGSAWIYFSFVRNGGTPTNEVGIPSIDTTPTNNDLNTVDNAAVTEPVTEESNGQETSVLTTSSVDEQILFGEPVDTDGDGLDDVREAQVGTDAKNWDTDGDNLSDGDEVIIWKTDPMKKDTDGDTYDDGAEVKNGYNPNGTGKLFEPPTTTQP